MTEKHNFNLKLGEEAYTILLNTKGDKSGLSDELSELLSYIRDPKHKYHTELVTTIDEIVIETKGAKETEEEFMLVSAKDIDKLETAMQAGISRGIDIGRTMEEKKIITQLLKTLSVEEVAAMLKKDKKEIEEIMTI